MAARYALLDDNQRLLDQRLTALRERLPALVGERICAAMVIGSVSEGLARDDSDIDLLLVLRAGAPRRTDYSWWDGTVAPLLGEPAGGRFPVQPVIVSRDSLHTTEPHLRRAIARGIPLWDPLGVFDDQPESRP